MSVTVNLTTVQVAFDGSHYVIDGLNLHNVSSFLFVDFNSWSHIKFMFANCSSPFDDTFRLVIMGVVTNGRSQITSTCRLCTKFVQMYSVQLPVLNTLCASS